MSREANDIPWSFSGLLFAMDRARDDEGRPVAERRAPSDAKRGVEIELRPAPYGDRRKQLPMNVSALAQIARHFDDVLSDVAGFHGALDELLVDREATWDRMFLAVVDQLAGPAYAVVPQGAGWRVEPSSVSDGVSARRAVGHKLAAGYFGVLRDVLTREACGESLEVSPEAFMRVVDDGGWLVGASEACAGPRPMIARSTLGFLGADRRDPAGDDRRRARVALALAAQIRVGVAWQLFDTFVERAVLLDTLGPEKTTPRNAFIAREVDTRREEHRQRGKGMRAARRPRVPRWVDPRPASVGQGSTTIIEDALGRLERVFDDPTGAPDYEALRGRVPELVAYGDGAMRVDGDEDVQELARLSADYFAVERATLEALEALEGEVRSALGEGYGGPFEPSTVIFPAPRAQRWLEALLGHRCERLGATRRFANHRRKVDVAGPSGPA